MPTKGELTKQHILLCAEKVFSQKGYYQAQVSDISNMAHIAKGTIYQYFTTKEHLFVSLIEKYVSEWESEVKLNIGDFVGSGSAQDYALGYVAHRMSKTIIYFARNEDRTNIISRMSLGVNEVIEQVVHIFEEKVINVIVGDIRLGKRFGHINSELNEELTGNAILGAIMRVAYFYFVMKKESLSKINAESFTSEVILLVQNTLNMFHTENREKL